MSREPAFSGTVTITLFLLAEIQTKAGKQSTKAATAANTPCKMAPFMEKLVTSLQTKLAAEMIKTKERTDEAATLGIAIAAAETDNKRLGYNILRAIALQAQADQIARLKQLDTAYAPAVRQLVNVSTRLRSATMLHNRKETKKGTNSGSAVSHDLSSGHQRKKKSFIHMTSAAMSALVLLEIVDLHSNAIQNKAANSSKLQVLLEQAAVASLNAATENIAKAALSIALLLAKKLRQFTTVQLAFADQLVRAQTKLAKLTGHQFGTASCDDLKVPSIMSNDADTDSITGGSGNIYLTEGPKTYAAATHTTFNTKRQHSIAWANQGNFDKLKICKLKLKDKGGVAAAPLIGKEQTAGGSNDYNLCVVSGAVTLTTQL
uniref:Variant surface glycoprotein 1125.1386 n=1 Tax=Trypanosoma brucei TaxID=5691 RepID=A0A1J0R757_9TRYP|nr:variant surface glycoprotein 1125.1386 [Trypanosoma brucei]